MITKTFKWICYSNLNVEKIGCLMSDGEVVAYTTLEDDDDLSEMDSYEFYQPNDNDHIFNSRDEAVGFREHLKKTYISKLKEVAPIIEELKYNKNDDIDLGQYIDALKPASSYYADCYNAERKINDLFLMVIRTGFICINAKNIKVSEVVNVEWHRNGNEENYAVLKTKGGDEVKTCNEAEFNAVEYLFGNNTSKRYYRS